MSTDNQPDSQTPIAEAIADPPYKMYPLEWKNGAWFGDRRRGISFEATNDGDALNVARRIIRLHTTSTHGMFDIYSTTSWVGSI